MTNEHVSGRRTSDYDFDLPLDLIAQFPSATRESSRLLVIDRANRTISHRRFLDLVEIVAPGDLMVVNETRVFPARLRGRRAGGGDAEVLLLNPIAGDTHLWKALVRPGAKLKTGRAVIVGTELSLKIEGSTEDGGRLVRFETDLDAMEAIARYGQVPLPPYVRREPTAADQERYQTVYARTTGSVAAPTAGLHFTPELIDRLTRAGVRFVPLVLHVGVGTFRPVDTDDPAEHRMHSEWYQVPETTAAEINRTRSVGGAVWAVGTTTVRTLESVVKANGEVPSQEGWTDIFIRPPHEVTSVDRLITNFHLPRSTLLMLVAAFAGYDLVMESYREAIAGEYRFYSYGDAMAVI